MTELEHEDIMKLLSVPAAGIAGQVSRRRFLQGALATGTIAGAPSWFDPLAAAATPVAATEGIVVILHFGGGNDGLNTVVPIGNATYRARRGRLAITSPLPLTSSFGLHPALPKLKARFDAGKVAIIEGVGQSTVTDLSHFSSTASWMAGTAGPARTTGWLGRWLDGVTDSAEGLRAVTLGSSVPLHLVGQASVVTALDLGGELFGSDRSEPWKASVCDAVIAYGSGPTGKGVWADRLAAAGAISTRLAADLQPSFRPAFEDESLASQLTLVARLINANLGIRVFNVSLGSFDTHEGQLRQHQELLADLDAGVAAFYAALASTWTRRVSLVSFSEFGRRVEANGSAGTDHGTSSVLFVIGENVKGGFYGEAPRLDQLDNRGNARVAVDYRSVYASVLSGWLGGDASGVLGGTYPDLALFRAGPGATPPPPPTTTGPWQPFATPSDLVRQQYLDFYGRVGDAGGVTYWTKQLVGGRRSVVGVIDAFLHSAEFGRSVAPVARLALLALGGLPAFDDLMGWAAQVKAGASLASVAPSVCAKPAFASRYGALSDAAFVSALFADALGRNPTATERSSVLGRLSSGAISRPGLVVELVVRKDVEARWQPQVEVLMTYAGLLRRTPDASGWSYWVRKVREGTQVQRLIAQFFSSAEYRRRFTG